MSLLHRYLEKLEGKDAGGARDWRNNILLSFCLSWLRLDVEDDEYPKRILKLMPIR